MILSHVLIRSAAFGRKENKIFMAAYTKKKRMKIRFSEGV